jgi:primosomal protein N' (replication factor Y)
MWLQTHHPKHALFEALKAHDYVRFATDQLRERQLANMPPFSSQALIRVEARTAHAALGYLNELHTQGSGLLQEASGTEPGSSLEDIFLYSAVPMQMQKLANVERYQLLIESGSRAQLQRFLRRLHEPLRGLKKKHPGVLRWVIDVDPQSL